MIQKKKVPILALIYQCGIVFWHIAFAPLVVLPTTSLWKVVSSFLLENWECPASTDSTKKLTIIQEDATIASTIIIVCNWFIFFY